MSIQWIAAILGGLLISGIQLYMYIRGKRELQSIKDLNSKVSKIEPKVKMEVVHSPFRLVSKEVMQEA